MAGHSKWANIQHRKGRQDAKRGKIFSKLVKEITVAARMAGGDINFNPRLRTAVSAAKEESMPADNISRAIKRGTGELEGINYEEIRYEGYGAGGVAVIVETMTDNRNRTASNVRSIFSKYGGNLGETGSVSFMFDRVGLISYSTTVASPEEILEVSVDAGAEDVESSENEHDIFCTDTELSKVSQILEEQFGESLRSKLIWRPHSLNELGLEQAEKLIKLIEALEDDDDVQNVTANFVVSDEVLNLL